MEGSDCVPTSHASVARSEAEGRGGCSGLGTQPGWLSVALPPLLRMLEGAQG